MRKPLTAYSFLSWYYYVAPNHNTFALVRRTMTLGNFAAFIIFTFYPVSYTHLTLPTKRIV